MASNRILSSVIVFLFVFSPGIDGYRQVLNVGAIFEENNYESEIAFKYAIDRINMYSHNMKLEPIINKVPRGESFRAGKVVCNFTSGGVAAIFGPTTPENNGIVQSTAAHFELPHFQLFWSPTSAYQNPNALNLWPDANTLSQALADIVKKMEWVSFTIIYQHDESLIRLQEVLKNHGPNDSPITVRQLPDALDYRPFLKEIFSSSESRIMIDCDPERTMDILKQSKEIGMAGDYDSFFIVSLDAHTVDFGEFKYSLTNITSVRLINPESSEIRNAVNDWVEGERRKGLVFEIEPQHVRTETALTHDAINLFAMALANSTHINGIETESLPCGTDKKWSYGYHFSQFVHILSHRGLSGPMQFDHNGRRTMFQLEIIELTKHGFKRIGLWDPLNGTTYNQNNDEKMSQMVESLQNKTFRVASRIGAPYLSHVIPPEGVTLEGNARYEGYVMDLIDHISKIHHFKYEFEIVKDNKYGSYDPKTKKWDGLIKQLLDRQADLAVCDLTITSQRRKAVDFTLPFMSLGIGILYSNPEKPPRDLFKFMSPFSEEVWLYMMTAFLAMNIFIYIIARLNPLDWENPHPCNQNPEELENIWGLQNCFWLTLGSIMGQGCDILPKGISTRLGIGAWWFFSLIMISSYTANLAAFLTMDRMESTINNAEDLVRQNKVKYGCVGGGSTATFFKESNFSTYKKMGAAMESARPSVFVKSNDEGVERVMKPSRDYAYLMESTSIEYVMQTKCKLKRIGDLLDSKGYGIAMPVNSPYRSLINGAVLKLQEDGTLHELKEKWWKHKQSSGESCSAGTALATESSAELDWDNVGGMFVVLGCGCAMAFCIAILEFLWNVKKVAIDNVITPWEALCCELKFALQITKSTKPVKPPSEPSRHSSGSGSDNRSIAANILKTAGSFLHIDNVFEKK